MRVCPYGSPRCFVTILSCCCQALLPCAVSAWAFLPCAFPEQAESLWELWLFTLKCPFKIDTHPIFHPAVLLSRARLAQSIQAQHGWRTSWITFYTSLLARLGTPVKEIQELGTNSLFSTHFFFKVWLSCPYSLATVIHLLLLIPHSAWQQGDGKCSAKEQHQAMIPLTLSLGQAL